MPCQEPAVTIEKARPGEGKGFKRAAEGKRGVTAWVEREPRLPRCVLDRAGTTRPGCGW